MATTVSRKTGGSVLISAYSSAASIRASGGTPLDLLEPIERIWRDDCLRAPRGGAPRRDERVAQNPQQIAQVVLGAQHPRLSQHPSERLLDETSDSSREPQRAHAAR